MTVDSTIASHVAEIKALPYAEYVISEDVINRSFGYKIIRQQISAGRNSVIYRCESTKMPDVYCVVKAYKYGKDKVKMSLREETCQIMRYVSGKISQIISTYDIYYTNEKIYLMCDWTSRGDVLTNMRHKSIRLNEHILHTWAIDLFNAIDFLHSNAICHRNLAPSCLLLTNDSHVKIGSLGDACIYVKPDGTLIKQKWVRFSRVSNWNQPPEVAKGRQYDPRRADIWSAGATLYWFVTRNHPIDYRSNSRMTKQLDLRLSIMRKVSNRCQDFIKKVLAFQPANRPTINQALEMEWLGGAGRGPHSADQTHESGAPEITVSEKAADPGEATGPEEAEAEQSTSKNVMREPGNKSP